MTKSPGKPLKVSLKWLNFINSGLQVAKCSSLAENFDGPAAETGQLGSQKQVRIIHDYIFGLEALISLQFP